MANSEGKTIGQISELNRICHIGPIGRWGAVESTFPFWFEEIVFNEDGTATWTTESGMFPRETVSLRWRMERWGRLIIEETDEEDGETLESAREIGFKLQPTEFGSALVMVTYGSDVFWRCFTALQRRDPPLQMSPQQALAEVEEIENLRKASGTALPANRERE